ncbi:transcriptional regulator [Deinococcus aetherius]|uniref:Transcriptional regulator n=1 Tax=Deinococcus aetherius TaxID=200252 RepID=A0ABM8A910_9DEIO|nr:substrate-binding domain-containing protein [Deinococcus aetherius]BDP40240.1 transcriptional regulator [Deinococcus aetherius]
MPPAKPSPGRRVTLRDVAARLGVSLATVSNAYNRPDQLSPELRERVLGAARELGYGGPDPLARSLRRGRTNVIGVVYDAPLEYAFADPAAALFLGAVAHTLQERGLSLLLLASPHGTRPVQTASVDGFVVYCAAGGGELLGAVLGRGLPTVLMDQAPQPGTSRVGIDDAGGAREAARHLTGLGHRHLGVLSLELSPERRGGPVPPEREAHVVYETTATRLWAYREAAGGAGARLFVSEAAQNTPDQGERLARDLLAAHPEVTGLLCMSDVLAQGGLRAAQALGRRVPEDLSLVGFDDLPSSAALNLSTVWQPTTGKGARVGEAILALLDGDGPEDVTLPTRLVVRGTTAGVLEGAGSGER